MSAAVAWLAMLHSAQAAPDFLADCTAAESSAILRIESCSFALDTGSLTAPQRAQALLNRSRGYTAVSMIEQAQADLAEARRLAPDDLDIALTEGDLAQSSAASPTSPPRTTSR